MIGPIEHRGWVKCYCCTKCQRWFNNKNSLLKHFIGPKNECAADCKQLLTAGLVIDPFRHIWCGYSTARHLVWQKPQTSKNPAEGTGFRLPRSTKA